MKGLGASAGYTLSEMLVALLILGLAMGGLMQASALIGRLQSAAQRRVSEFEAGRRLQQGFAGLFDRRGPFLSSSSELEGDADGFHFDCGAEQCGAGLVGDGAKLTLDTPARTDLKLRADGAAHFEYVGTATTGDVWPPEGRAVQQLTAIRMIGGDRDPVPIAAATIWRQEPAGCQFDTIAKACRGARP